VSRPQLDDVPALRAWGAQQLVHGFAAGLLFAQLAGVLVWALA